MSDSDIRNHQGDAGRRYRLRPAGAGRSDGAGLPRLGPIGGDHVDDLVAGYALGALEPTERERVERHIRVCPACERLVAEDSRTVGFLPLAAPPALPAPDVKVAVFARIAHAQRAAAEADLPTRSIAPTLTLPTSRPIGIPVEPAPTATVPSRRLPSWRGSRAGWAASFLSLPLLLALVLSGVWSMQLRAQVAQQGDQVSDLQAQLANFGDGATSYQLSPGPAAPQAEGRIVIGADQRGGMLEMRLNTPPPERAYELLVVRDGKVARAARVKVDDRGVGHTTFTLEHPFAEYQTVEVQARPLPVTADEAGEALPVLSGDIDQAAIGAGGSTTNDALP